MKRLTLIGFLVAVGMLRAQSPFAPRANHGARLEPQGALVQGAGQDPAGFAAYWNTVPIGRQPQVYMCYVRLDTLAPNWADDLKAQLLVFPGSFLIPQIGVSMTDGVNAHYEADVAAGNYDAQIGYLVSGLRELATPAYLRIGYEFNGLSWNGYRPAPYAQAYIRITNALRAATDIEAATVWDAEVDGVTNYMDYYPGDAYVDWFGMNVFNGSSWANPNLQTFVSLANSHNKPLMLGELTPATTGAQGGAASWSAWFAPFFNFLQTVPAVKAYNYINWNWAYWATVLNDPTYATWGDARLELPTAAYVRNLYIGELADPAFLNDSSETNFRRLLGYNYTTPPPAVSDLQVSATSNMPVLTWTPVTDLSGIARYYLYRNGTLLDFSLRPPYRDTNAAVGKSTYSIAVMDRAGNMSALSPAQTVSLTQLERLKNGGFENGLTYWRFPSYAAGAVGTAVIDTNNPIDGTASVKIGVSQSTGTDWQLQLNQSFQMTQGLTYTVSFKARASAPVTLPVVIQQIASPNTIYLYDGFTAGTSAASFRYSFTANTSQPVIIAFYVDNIGSVTLWLDDISVLESNAGAAAPPNLLASGVLSAASFVPGVAPGAWITVLGANLAPVASDTWANEIVNGRLPSSLDGVSVSLGGQPAYIYYVSPGQINALASNISAGQTTLTVTTPAGTTAPVTVNVAAQAPAFFLWPGNQAVATRIDWSLAVKPGTFAGLTTTAAHPGDIIILWGTGFGATTPPVTPGIEVPADQAYNCDPVTATLGGQPVTVYGCALSPGYAGLYQVAIQVPTTQASGDYALRVMIDGAVSPPGVILSVAQ